MKQNVLLNYVQYRRDKSNIDEVERFLADHGYYIINDSCSDVRFMKQSVLNAYKSSMSVNTLTVCENCLFIKPGDFIYEDGTFITQLHTIKESVFKTIVNGNKPKGTQIQVLFTKFKYDDTKKWYLLEEDATSEYIGNAAFQLYSNKILSALSMDNDPNQRIYTDGYELQLKHYVPQYKTVMVYTVSGTYIRNWLSEHSNIKAIKKIKSNQLTCMIYTKNDTL